MISNMLMFEVGQCRSHGPILLVKYVNERCMSRGVRSTVNDF